MTASGDVAVAGGQTSAGAGLVAASQNAGSAVTHANDGDLAGAGIQGLSGAQQAKLASSG